MKYAVIKTGGKQYKVQEGDIIEVERVVTLPEQTITFPEVLLVSTDGVAMFGQPIVENVSVQGKVLSNMRGEKIRVSKFKAKVRYRRVTGHRQELSKIQIESIVAGTSSRKATPDNSEKQASVVTKPTRRTTTKTSAVK